jgi:hypothetical protein
MLDETAKAVVTCPTCRHHTEQRVGWFKTVAVWDCPFCGAALEIDYDQFTAFLASKTAADDGYTARLSPRPNRGITTRRTR